MKRIYYGNITADVSDEVAAKLAEVIDAMAWKPLMGWRTQNGMGTSVMLGRGLQEFRSVACYLNGGDDETTVDLWVGGAVPIAIAPLHPAKPDPAGSATTLETLKAFLAADNDN